MSTSGEVKDEASFKSSPHTIISMSGDSNRVWPGRGGRDVHVTSIHAYFIFGNLPRKSAIFTHLWEEIFPKFIKSASLV